MRLLPLALAAALLAGCDSGSAPPPDYTLSAQAYDPHPQVPAILRDVALIDDDARFTAPFVPGHRTTMDGRVALRVQGGPPGTTQLAQNLSFYLFVPEKLDAPVLDGPAGATILADTEPFDVVFPPALDPEVERLGHHAICDPTTEFPVAGERPNPYPCGNDGRNDCYDITVVSSTSPGLDAQMWGTPVTVEIEAPKTRDARIVDVRLGEPVAGTVIRSMTEFTEPAVTLDGRLLTGRLGRFPRRWINPVTGERKTRQYDLAYALLPDDAEPCDVTGWTDFHPMSHAPFDPRMIGRYGLAAYPFRDSEGNLIPDGEDLGGTYPWVDREGANVFMAAVHGRIVEQSEEKYPRRCVTPGCEDFMENTDWDRGYLVAGLWTHGKFVQVDGMINHLDWAVGVTPASHWLVDLYRDPDGNAVPVRVGSGRFIDAVRYAGGPYPAGYTHNANIVDSLQNLPNHHLHAQPTTPRDVVWLMSNGVATDEIAFDDFLDPDALIVSNMRASVTQLHDEAGASLAIPHHWNGDVRTLLKPFVLQMYPLEPDGFEEIHLQNAATSLRWNVPAYGLVEAATGRVEPAALGGVEGKGFWLSGDNAVRYAVPDQPRDIVAEDTFVGIFVDPRAGEDEVRELLRFPDGTAVRLVGRSQLLYVVDDVVVRVVELPDTDERWIHLAWRLRDGHRDVTFLHDGFALDRWVADEPLFTMVAGDLVVGRETAPWTGVRGWIDDLVVLAHDVDPEVACNHARGTLVRLDAAPRAWNAIAARHPRWAHDEVASAAGGSSGERFACWRDIAGDRAAHLRNLPEGTVSVRQAIHFPEGPLRAGQPRPDSSANPFCLSCHREEGLGGLSTAALEYRPEVAAEDDPRRQPLQPPRRVFGNIPAGWIPAGPGPGGPDVDLQAPPEGLVIDPWVLPEAERE